MKISTIDYNRATAIVQSSLFTPEGALKIPAIVVSLLIAFLVIQVIHIKVLSGLAQIPGPLFASFSRLWLAYHSRKGDMHRAMQKLHKRYGSIVRTAPNEVSISDVEALRQIYGAGSKFRKSDWYSVARHTARGSLCRAKCRCPFRVTEER